jgi:hypothetical protein
MATMDELLGATEGGGEDPSAEVDEDSPQQQQPQPPMKKKAGGNPKVMKAELNLTMNRKQMRGVAATGAVIYADG